MPRLEFNLSTVIAVTVEEALNTAPDSWVRLEVAPDWPVGDALQRVANTVPCLRIGLLHPFEETGVSIAGISMSSEPSEITTWRNATGTEASCATVVLGDARGPDEAGLRNAPIVIEEHEVIGRWAEQALGWLEEAVPAVPASDLLRELVEAAQSGAVDPLFLDDYTSAVAESKSPLEALKSNLWMLDLIPDARVLDAGRARSRLMLNIESRALLLTAADSAADARRLDRLTRAAAVGDAIASAAVQYRATRDRFALSGMDLDGLLSVLSPKAPTMPKDPTPRDVWDLLDTTRDIGQDRAQQALQDLSNAWDLDGDEAEISTTVVLDDGSEIEFRIEVTPEPAEGPVWLADPSLDEQAIAFVADSTAARDWLQAPGKRITGGDLMLAAETQDAMLGGQRFSGAVQDLLGARALLGPFERWLRNSAVPLLLLKQGAREAVRSYRSSWLALVNLVNETAAADTTAIRNLLVLLDAVWGKQATPEQVEWSVLGPFHQYLLDPQLRAVEYGLTELGEPSVGERVGWALDRSVPAYRALWLTTDTLFLAREGPTYEFTAVPERSRPPATTGDGMYQIIRSFLGFHPHARNGLVLTIVDPPPGGAVTRNLRRAAREVQDMRVYVVATSGDSAHLEEAGDLVGNLGRFASLSEWAEKRGSRSHIIFYFAKRQPGGAASAHGEWGPTPGAHVALKVRLEAPGPLANDQSLRPFVTFEPREGNEVVLALQKLAAGAMGTPRLFEVEPMLSEEDARQLDSVTPFADWAVIGAPGPLGLIAPRSLGEGLSYLGPETLGPYGLFAYATDLFSIRKFVTSVLQVAPVIPDPEKVEARLTDLASQSADAVLRIGRGGLVWEQVAAMVAVRVSSDGDEDR